jgi:hypothetical protein
MVFNATFDNIAAISWLSVLLVEQSGVPRENHRPVVSQVFLLIMIYVLIYSNKSVCQWFLYGVFLLK